jgi:PTS system ascorbate-specific IIA component
MVSFLLITHAPVGAALREAVAHVFGGAVPRCEAIDVIADESLADIQARACVRIDAMDDGDGVLVLSDLYGASPCNCASRLSQPGRVEVISGVSLPLLIRAINYRTQPLPQLAEQLISSAAQGVVRIASHAPQNQMFRPIPDAQARHQHQQ